MSSPSVAVLVGEQLMRRKKTFRDGGGNVVGFIAVHKQRIKFVF
jgi:hypothetical protein